MGGVEERADLERTGLLERLAVELGVGGQRLDQFTELVAVDGDGGEEARGQAGGHLAHIVGDGEPTVIEHRTRGVDDLLLGGIGGGDLQIPT